MLSTGKHISFPVIGFPRPAVCFRVDFTETWEVTVRRGFAILAVLAVCGAATCPSQPHRPGPRGPLDAVLAPHRHAAPAPANPEHTPTVYVDATGLGSPVTLDKNWRVGITANPAAANPDFDDSTWTVRNASESIEDVPDEDHPANAPPGGGPPGRGRPPEGHGDHQRPYVWFREHIKLAPGHGPLALLVQLPVSRTSSVSVGSGGPGIDVFADGKQIQPEGPHGADPGQYEPMSRIYRLNISPDATSLLLAVRTFYIPVGYATYTGFFANRTFILGHPDDLSHSLELWWNHSLFERLPRLAVSILFVVLALFLIALFYAQKGHNEYLWLALHELAQSPLAFLEIAGITARIDTILYGALFVELLAISAYLYFEFLVAFLDLPHRWGKRRQQWIILPLRIVALPMLAGTGPTIMLVGHGRTVVAILLVIVFILSIIWFIGWLLFCFITLIAATTRRNFEAGMLLFPLVLTFVGVAEPMITGIAQGFNEGNSHIYHSPLTFQAGPIPIHFASIADFVGLLAIVLIIFFRFLRIQREQERASSELAAARSMQELMIPQEQIKTPGFEVDSVYNPANEVGGDFYHVESTPDGGLLVVIGDVAGKGLKAAMNVSMVMGALRRISDHSPGRILTALNRVLLGGESFTTCQAALFSPNGELVIANAGHLPPYLNTQEIWLPGGLPLGVIANVEYEERRLYLHPGDRLLLTSDGVVEARQPSGELFGFDRLHNLSSQTAFYIADAAKSFGQEDDITVLTVRRLAQAMAA
jgi:phosphoserine phosphatase RsbU/P